jgi:hypothetical protein
MLHEIGKRAMSAHFNNPSGFPGYAVATFLGRPPFRPFSRDAATLAMVRERPPSAPSWLAIHAFRAEYAFQKRRHIEIGIKARPVKAETGWTDFDIS